MYRKNETRSDFCQNCIGIAAIIAAIGFTVQNVQEAYGSGPIINHGNFPYESFTGSISNGNSTTLLTVPSGQIFIVTGGNSDGHYCDLYEDNSMILEGNSTVLDSEGGLFSYGEGHLEISSGSDLSISASGSTCTYYIEGYYAG